MKRTPGQGLCAAVGTHLSCSIPLLLFLVGSPLWGAAATLYSIGEPTDEEQLYVELINRARANPSAEALRLRNTEHPEIRNAYTFFSVDLDLMQQDISALPPAPPLSIHPRLTLAARRHSLDMLNNRFQGHFGSDGSDPGDRITDAGYAWNRFGENVFANARSVEHGHAGFEVDWGQVDTIGGMQNPPGHRLAIHDAQFREVGVGVLHTTESDIGPEVVTQNFGSRGGITPFITGVVYFDLNQNGFYDLGEGVGSVRVDVAGAGFFALTPRSGGYSVPVSGNGTHNLTFTVANMASVQRTVTVASGENVKVDLVLQYTPPTVSGPDFLPVNVSSTFNLSPAPGAEVHRLTAARHLSTPFPEGAESGNARVEVMSSPGYQVFDSNIRSEGQFAFRLAHPTGANQVVQLTRTFLPRAGSELVFDSRLGWASGNQRARVEVSTDEGGNWEVIWERAGTGNSGQGTFQQERVSLERLSGVPISIRFVYAFVPGLFFNQTDPGVGWYFDNIQFQQMGELIEPSMQQVTSSTFNFVPATEGEYLLTVQPEIAGRVFPAGSGKLVRAALDAPVPVVVRIIGLQPTSGGRMELTVATGNAVSDRLRLESAGDPAGPWQVDQDAEVQPSGASAARVLTSPPVEAQRFYRIVVLP